MRSGVAASPVRSKLLAGDVRRSCTMPRMFFFFPHRRGIVQPLADQLFSLFYFFFLRDQVPNFLRARFSTAGAAGKFRDLKVRRVGQVYKAD